jgi:hypothetical protein
MTLVSFVIRRFSAVEAYALVAVEYPCLRTALCMRGLAHLEKACILSRTIDVRKEIGDELRIRKSFVVIVWKARPHQSFTSENTGWLEASFRKISAELSGVRE